MLTKILKYVEIMTKITSFFPFWLTLAFLLYQGTGIQLGKTAIFFAAMFLFDLATTAINNYIDSKTNDQDFGLSRSFMALIIAVLLLTSTGLGVLLVLKTDLVVLLVGMLAFACGVLYTAGPIPISRQPLGEIFSGAFYGLIIPFLILYINHPETFLEYSLSMPGFGLDLTVYGQGLSELRLRIKLEPFVSLLLFSITPAFATANIMLANNICDVEKDILVKRFTLAFYLGKNALTLFAVLYYACFASTILLVVLRIFPPLSLVSLLAFIPVQKNIRSFFQKQDKATTFVTSVKNFILLVVPNIFLLAIASVFR